MSSILGEDLDSQVRELMKLHRVSPKVGFLAENPLCLLPYTSGDGGQNEYFAELNKISCMLTKLIQIGRVRETVMRLKVPVFSFTKFPWEVQNLAAFMLARLVHAYFREILPYKNVGELMLDNSVKYLPRQLALPLWELSKLTGVAPSQSYCFYSLWNYRKPHPLAPLSLNNIDTIFTFTATLDEKWFVWIHQIVEMKFAPAVAHLLKCHLLSLRAHQPVTTQSLTEELNQAALGSEVVVDVLKAMRAHCDYRTYFEKVRLFYSFPRRVVFEGVEELAGEPQEVLGETGGQTPYQHFRLAVLGAYPVHQPYFAKMREHIQKNFRELIELMLSSRVREYVLEEKKCGNTETVDAYNRNLRAIIAWREEHFSLVNDYIKTFGETHGTGKPPLTWLRDLINDLAAKLI